MPGGRPTKYDEKYCEELISHMSEGFTFESFAGRIGVCRDTIYRWAKENVEFSDAKKLGRAAQQFKDESTLQKMVEGKNIKGNMTGLIFKMKNCHGWRDKVEQEQTATIQVRIDKDDERV